MEPLEQPARAHAAVDGEENVVEPGDGDTSTSVPSGLQLLVYQAFKLLVYAAVSY